MRVSVMKQLACTINDAEESFFQMTHLGKTTKQAKKKSVNLDSINGKKYYRNKQNFFAKLPSFKLKSQIFLLPCEMS